MTMNKITAKLLRKNQAQYRILGICILLSVLLVSSFGFMYFSPTVQKLLPDGGDTRKLFWLMLGVTVLGCTIFTVYGAGLFFKYKSREFGVFLALGERKSRLRKQLARELAVVIGKYTLAGMLLAIPFSFLIWKLFYRLIVSAGGLQYRIGAAGIAVGVLFALFLILCILFSGIRFIKRANVMDILNEQRKTEMVKEIKPWTGKVGIILVFAGLVLAIGVPQLTVSLFMQKMPAVWNVLYLVSAVGLYLFMLSAVGHAKKGHRPQKYYKNIISTNLMRFTARQTTRNMCVITLLIFVTLTTVFWGAMYYDSAASSGLTAAYDYSMHFPALEDQVTSTDIEELAKKHEVEISDYEEAKVLELIIHYTQRDMDDAGRYFDIQSEKLASFISASDFTRISGIPVSLKAGEYQTVVYTDFQRGIWVGPDCLTQIEHPVTKDVITPIFAGTVECDNLVMISDPFMFVLADSDYAAYEQEASDAWMEQLILFKVKDVMNTYAFAEELKNMYIAHATELSDHIGNYDAHEEALALQAGESYWYTGQAGLSPENHALMGDWKYAPFSKVLTKADAMQRVAVFVLLSIYISVISLAAVAVMSYIRSVTIAMDNRQLFEDLNKLGANQAYVVRVIRMQLRKIISYPAAAGGGITSLFMVLLYYFNDMRIDAFEVKMLCAECLMAVLCGVFMYILYRVSLKKMREIAEV